MSLMLPQLVAHADWSVNRRKRWWARAMLGTDGRYRVLAPEPVPNSADWLRALEARAAHGELVLLGVDFPIGLPLAYANRAGIVDFLAILPQLGAGEWSEFFRAAEAVEEIGVKRPFYPQRPGGARQQHLIDRLGVANINALRRRCDLPQPGRRAAAPLFWTIGAQQVGKAAGSGWQELLQPALANTALSAMIWPFDGTWAELRQPEKLVFAEAYPAEFYRHLGINFRRQMGQRWGKRVAADRQANETVLLAAAERMNVTLGADLATEIKAGFGSGPDGEDPFDAVVGLLGLLHTVTGERPLTEPTDPDIRRIEGWIWGQQPATNP